MTLLKRLPALADVGNVAALMASDYAGTMTGTVANDLRPNRGLETIRSGISQQQITERKRYAKDHPMLVVQ